MIPTPSIDGSAVKEILVLLTMLVWFIVGLACVLRIYAKSKQ